jgi:hypothetical protein
MPLPVLQITAQVSDIAHSIQLSVAPVFLLAGVAGILNLLASRLARVVDRARVVEANFTGRGDPKHARQVWELRLLDRRIIVVNAAIFLCTASAVLICMVVAGLFVAGLSHWHVGRSIAFGFILAMGLLVTGLITFLIEVHLGSKAVRVPLELISDSED